MERRDSNLNTIYETYANMLYRISYSLLLSKEDAEDAVSEVFTTYLKKKVTHRDEEHEKAWFIRVTINKSKDIQRKRMIRKYIPLDQIQHPTVMINKTNTLLDEVNKLDIKYKTVVLLHYYEEFSVKEIADILHIGTSSVKMRLLRARKLLKLKIEEEALYD